MQLQTYDERAGVRVSDKFAVLLQSVVVAIHITGTIALWSLCLLTLVTSDNNHLLHAALQLHQSYTIHNTHAKYASKVITTLKVTLLPCTLEKR